MHFKETRTRARTRLTDHLESTDRFAHELYAKLVTERRWFVVLSAGIVEFRRKKMRYFTGYFAYNGFLGVLALLIGLASILGMFLKSYPSLKDNVSPMFKTLLPVIGGTPGQAMNALTQYRNVLGAVSFIALLWTGTKVFGALELGFCQIWEIPKRKFTRGKVLGLLFITVIGLLFLTSIVALFAFTAFWGWAVGKEGALYDTGTLVFKPIVSLGFNFLLFLFVYQVVPPVKQALKKTALGALVSALLFLGVQYLLAYYFSSVSRIPNVYGSIATAVIMVVWLYVTGLIVFFGAGIIHVMQDEQLLQKHKEQYILPGLFRSLRNAEKAEAAAAEREPDPSGCEKEGAPATPSGKESPAQERNRVRVEKEGSDGT
jgi:membrane protein